jgi:hypothetical protein
MRVRGLRARGWVSEMITSAKLSLNQIGGGLQITEDTLKEISR